MRFELLPPVPAVTVVRQLRPIPLFSCVSVDELFRFSAIAQQVGHTQGSTFQTTCIFSLNSARLV